MGAQIAVAYDQAVSKWQTVQEMNDRLNMKNSLLESELEQKVKLLEEALKKKKETITAEKNKLKLVKGQLYLEDVYVGDEAAFLDFHAKLQAQA